VRAGLPLLVADLACQGQGGGVPGARRVGLAAGPQDLAQAIERLGLAGLVPDLLEQGQGPLVKAAASLMAALPQVLAAPSRARAARTPFQSHKPSDHA
jgi:hypothetical protein